MSEYQDFEDLYKIEAGRLATAEKRIEELEALVAAKQKGVEELADVLEATREDNDGFENHINKLIKRIEELEQKVIDAEHLAAERLSEMNRLSERYRDRWMEEESLATRIEELEQQLLEITDVCADSNDDAAIEICQIMTPQGKADV